MGKWGRKPPASLGPRREPPSQPGCRNSAPKQACARLARRRGENLLLPSGPSAGLPASPAVETPRPNRRVRVLPAAGEKASRFPRAQARAAQPARLSKLRAQTGVCASCPPQAKKKQPPYWATAFSVGENLFFRAVTSQVSSAPASLTSVFGMGTGGPSRQSTPTILFCRLSRRLNNNTTAFFKLQALFSKKFKNLLKHKI